jgi:hypothetical protein
METLRIMAQLQSNIPTTVDTKVEIVDRLTRGDLSDLCQAADDAIKGGGGFGWLTPPRRDVMESYWKGVLLVPDRTLIVGAWTMSSSAPRNCCARPRTTRPRRIARS